VLQGCAFVGNTAARGGALAVFSGTAVITGSSFVGNDAPLGAALRLNTATVQVSESVLAYNTGGDVADCVSATVQLTCCDLWGNETGDYAGCLAGQDGIAGNFSADPLFCSWPFGEVTLLPDSPCLPANNPCGVLVGAYGAPGCGPIIDFFVDTK
jgi:hypothetical protein